MTASRPSRTALAVVVVASLWSFPTAQPLKMLQPEDYARWEQLTAQRTPLSPDGQWLVYGITRAYGDSELRVQSSAGVNTIATIPYGEQPAFADDSRWLAALVGFSEEDEAKRRKERKPLHKSLRLVELPSGQVTTVEGIESFSFSPNGSFLAMRRYAPEAANAGGATDSGGSNAGDADERVRPGTTLVVRHLASARDTTFGSVSEVAWQDRSARLALVVTTEDGVGNGVQLFDAESGSLSVLDSSRSTYAGLAWRKDSPALAVLRTHAADGRQGPTHVALAWRDVTAPSGKRTLDPLAGNALSPDLRVVRFRRPQWSEDGARLYVGVAPWSATVTNSTSRSRRDTATSTDPDALPDVLVWHPKDTTVIPKQKIDARRDRERSMLAAWWVDEGRLVRVAQEVGQEATPIPRAARALVVDTNAHAMDRSIGRVYADVWTIDLTTGTRTPIGSRLLDRYVQASPGGRYVLYVRDDHYWTVDLASGRQTNLTAKIDRSFVDKASDDLAPQKPPFGVAGWATDDAAVLLYDEHDIWELAPDGSRAQQLTDGRAAGVRHRYVRLDPEEEWIDRSRPLLVSQFGLRSKKSGYARVAASGSASGSGATSLVWLDKRVDRLAKAKRADRFVYAVQGFDDSPDYVVSGERLADGTRVTSTNPFMAEYAWGRAELVEYRGAGGQPLQGALYYPAGYQAGQRYPMVVYMYEKLSDGLHTFSLPSERSVYNAAAFTTRGYFYFQPDIVFRPREPGVSVVESVLPAVQRIVSLGLVDAARVGIVGHSWGGFDSVYLATHTTAFAAAVAGAPITNLVSNYGNHHWSSGIAETDHIETGQQRMQVPVYEDLPAYIRNSAVFKAHSMSTPLLMMFGENDGTVHWHQGVELYNIARRAGRNVVMLAYAGEDHGLRRRANQIDYHHRIFEWFDHYLRGTPAERWITHGERFLEREQDLRQRKAPPKPRETTTPQG